MLPFPYYTAASLTWRNHLGSNCIPIYIMLHNLLQGNFSLPRICSHSLSSDLETGLPQIRPIVPVCCQESEGPKACAASYERKNVTWRWEQTPWEHVSTTEGSDILEWSFMHACVDLTIVTRNFDHGWKDNPRQLIWNVCMSCIV